jgi:glycosidase
MQWNESPHGGFSTVKPWMRVHDDYPKCNAKRQQSDNKSVLSFWKRMLALRKAHMDLFVYGDFELIDEADEELFCFTKEWNGEKALVVLNFTDSQQEFYVDNVVGVKEGGTLLTATVDAVKEHELSPYEGRVYLIDI